MSQGIIHRSKIGLEILLPLMTILGIVTGIVVWNLVWPGILVCAAIIILLGHTYTHTLYTITEANTLLIRCGVMERIEINIADIQWIKGTRDITSAPALSTDRLEIGYKGGRILISPQDKARFLSDLRQVNPRI